MAATRRFDSRLIDAVMVDDRKMISSLLACDVGVDDMDSYGRSALWHAARHGNIDLCKYLIDHGADVNMQDFDGTSPLGVAVSTPEGSKVLTLLAKSGADMDLRQGKIKEVALLVAIQVRPLAVVELMLDLGADRYAKDNDGLSPYAMARRDEMWEVKRIFDRHSLTRSDGFHRLDIDTVACVDTVSNKGKSVAIFDFGEKIVRLRNEERQVKTFSFSDFEDPARIHRAHNALVNLGGKIPEPKAVPCPEPVKLAPPAFKFRLKP